MKNKGLKLSKMYVILAIIFIIALVSIFALIKNTKSSNRAKPISNFNTNKVSSNRSTTKEASENKNIDTPPSGTLETAYPISVPLSEVIYGYEFKNNYHVSINYKNIIFDFNCNKYNEEIASCDEGSGLMRYNDLVIPLYTYKESNNNILDFAEDYYIDMKDNYIFLTNNHVGVSSGSTKIYNNQGSLLGEVSNVVTGYILKGKKYNVLYPSYSDNGLTFYYIDNGIVKIGYVDVTDPKVINELEVVEGAILN